jgi:S1-C subfamily serine protease
MERFMKTKYFTLITVAMLAMLVLSACSGTTTTLKEEIGDLVNTIPVQAAQTPQENTADTTISQADSGLLAAYENTLAGVYDKVNPSVVNIQVLQSASGLSSSGELPFNFDLPEGFELPEGLLPNLPQTDPDAPESDNPQEDTPQFSPFAQGLGSGFVWDDSGLIVTNNHVVENASKIEVIFHDGTSVEAELVGADPYSDLAVIKVDMPKDALRPVDVADSTQVKVGDLAIAIGNPYGLSGTMTVGIVSALGRSIPAGQLNMFSSGPSYTIPDIIQTDAPINPGNSGGVLVNDQGQVIGVTAAIESTTGANAGIGFVIPSAIVLKVVPGLIDNGSYQHPYLGITGSSLIASIAEAMDLERDQRGALVQEVVPDGPADAAGLRGSDRQATIDGQSVNVGGDVIVAINGEEIKDMDELIAYLVGRTKVGETVTLTILRDGDQEQVEVTLAARPGQTATQETQVETTEIQPSVWLGILGLPVNAQIASEMGLPEDTQGILLQQVEADSPADDAGLQGSFKPVEINGERILVGGDIITAADGKAVSIVEELRALLADKAPGDTIVLTILRNGEELEISASLEARP